MRRIDLTDCPEPLKTLLGRYDNNFEQTAIALGNKGSARHWLRKVAKRQDGMGPKLKEKIEALLKETPVPLPPKPTGPGPKKTTRGNKWTVHKMSDYPPLLQELIQKYGSTIRAAQALGMKSQYWVTKFAEGKAVFDKDAEARVRAALKQAPAAGKPVTVKKAKVAEKVKKAAAKKKAKSALNGIDDDPIDAGVLGIAIVLSTANVLESLYDAGTAMGGDWVFKKRVGKQWLSVCRLDPQELQAFRSIARVIAIEVATP